MIFPARCLFDRTVEDFMRMLPHLLAAGKPKCKLHIYKGMTYIIIGHARHAPSLLCVLSWQLMLKHFGLCVGLYLGLGHFSVVEFWSCHSLFWTWPFQCR